eukprot:scaffold1425_cov333-Prasinococcus_capsulatus_cf.AAC.4
MARPLQQQEQRPETCTAAVGEAGVDSKLCSPRNVAEETPNSPVNADARQGMDKPTGIEEHPHHDVAHAADGGRNDGRPILEEGALLGRPSTQTKPAAVDHCPQFAHEEVMTPLTGVRPSAACVQADERPTGGPFASPLPPQTNHNGKLGRPEMVEKMEAKTPISVGSKRGMSMRMEMHKLEWYQATKMELRDLPIPASYELHYDAGENTPAPPSSMRMRTRSHQNTPRSRSTMAAVVEDHSLLQKQLQQVETPQALTAAATTTPRSVGTRRGSLPATDAFTTPSSHKKARYSKSAGCHEEDGGRPIRAKRSTAPLIHSDKSASAKPVRQYRRLPRQSQARRRAEASKARRDPHVSAAQADTSGTTPRSCGQTGKRQQLGEVEPQSKAKAAAATDPGDTPRHPTSARELVARATPSPNLTIRTRKQRRTEAGTTPPSGQRREGQL